MLDENNFKEKWIEFINQLQDEICTGLEDVDGTKFFEESCVREEGGGGRTRVMNDGNVFEKAGVNTSVVFGDVTPTMQTQLKI
ncbi:MAG: coproporphyrinogen III oxidase, partial [Ferruginibacter sp.]